MRRADIAASSTTFLRNGASSRSADADETGRRKHNETDEHEAEPEQPVLGVDAEEFAEQDEEQRAERRAEETAHTADHDHGQEIAGERTEIGSAEVMRFWNSSRMPARPVIAADSTKATSL